jgi:serpin B
MKSLLGLTACLLALPAIAAETVDVKPTVTGNTAFALDLYDKLRTQPGNLFLSPYSISSALAMTCGGARGNTEKQMAAALRFTVPQERLHPGFATLQNRLNAIQQKKQVKLAIANSLWPQKGYEFLPGFVALCRDRYAAQPVAVDFAGATEAARKQINDWVEAKTNRKIQELFKPGVLDAQTRLVLANAIYFKGDWATPFDKQFTQELPFHLANGKQVTAPLMTRQAQFGYAAIADLQVLDLPYAGNALSMTILLPAKADGLAALEAQLTVAKLDAWLKAMQNREVNVVLPKFKTTAEFSLGETLQSLGMRDAFAGGQADFSGMTGKKDLFISAVVHKAFVEVNEEGTEAAAATGVGMALTAAMPQEPPVFRADHPYLFLIRDNQTGSVLFLGRVVDPKK